MIHIATLLVTALVSAEAAPLIAVDSPTTLGVLFVNDFTLNFVKDDVAKFAQKSAKCPGNAYPDAAAQFNFTSAVVDAIDSSIQLTLQYDFYHGGNGNHLNSHRFSREEFSVGASVIFKDFCFEGPQTSDLPTYVHNELSLASDVDVLILFTAASASELAAALPINGNEFKAVIVVGLNGADASSFYPDTSLTIADFSKPGDIASMIGAANIQLQKSVDSSRMN